MPSAPASSNRVVRAAVAHADAIALSLAFLATRWALWMLGVRFNAELDWMVLSDPEDLRRHPLQSVFYFHAFPPGLNIHTALLLWLSDEHFAKLAHASLMLFGWLQLLSIAYLGRAMGIPRWVAGSVALAFSVSPPAIFFENLWLYSLPSAALVTAAGACFHNALGSNSTWRWTLFFGACASLGIYRSIYHLVWFVVMLVIAVLLESGSRRKVLGGACGPGLVLTGLYLKNWIVFGVFGLTSWSGANVVSITTRQMPSRERTEWIQRGDLSPLANISVFAPPRAYLDLIEPRHYPWPTTNELEKPTTQSPNYNHGSYLEINPRRGQDSRAFVSRRPGAYLRTVLRVSVPQFFEPTTRWHLADSKPGSPHWGHRQVLGGYESTYAGLLHDGMRPLAPFGLYTALPGLIAWALWRAWRCAAADRRRAILLSFVAGQVVFLISVSCCFALGENARYRFLIEAFIWLMATAAVVDVVGTLRDLARRSTMRRRA